MTRKNAVQRVSKPNGIRPAATAKLMRMLNRSAILDLVRERGPIARAEISRMLDISQSTVMRIIDDLIAEQLVTWSGDIEASGGRPRPLLEFNPHAYSVIGLDLGGTKMYGTVADLSGTIQKEILIPWGEEAADSNSNIDRVIKLIEDLLAVPAANNIPVRGIGVGVPGVTESDRGIVRWAPSLGWRNLPLQQQLEDRFKLPVMVENDVNLAALGEFGFGVARGASSLVCLAVGTGIGSGIIINRKIYKGSQYSAGEVGYLPPELRFLGRSYPGFGALESIASGAGIEARAREYMQSHAMNIPDGLSAEMIFNSARSGEAWAQQLVDETIDYLGFAIAAISAILDPEVIVLGGGVARSADMLIPAIMKKIDGVIPSIPYIVQSNLGSRASVMGAILLVLDTTTERISVNVNN
jgi:predicted NBD/HSP70 family sugar kinase